MLTHPQLFPFSCLLPLSRSFWEAVLAPRTRRYSPNQRPGLGLGLASAQGPGLGGIAGEGGVMIPSGYKLSCITDTLRNVLASPSGNPFSSSSTAGQGLGLVQGMLAQRSPALGYASSGSDPSSSASSMFAAVVVAVGPVIGNHFLHTCPLTHSF